MVSIADLLERMRQNPEGVRFTDLCRVCDRFFGSARQLGTSHRIYRTPWPGDPRVNLQRLPGGKGKAYQVRQVLKAIEKLERDHD